MRVPIGVMPKKARVETVDPLDEPASAPGVVSGRGIACNPIPGPVIPSPTGHCIVAGFKLAPEGPQIRGAGGGKRHAMPTMAIPSSSRGVGGGGAGPVVGSDAGGRIGGGRRLGSGGPTRRARPPGDRRDRRSSDNRIPSVFGATYLSEEGPVEGDSAVRPPSGNPSPSRRIRPFAAGRRRQPQYPLGLPPLHEGDEQALALPRRSRGELRKQVFRRGRVVVGPRRR